MIQQKTVVLKKVWDNSVKTVELMCPNCGEWFKTKSGPSGYTKCKKCNQQRVKDAV